MQSEHHPLKVWRFHHSVSLEKLAKASRISVSMISAIETGKRKPSPLAADRIARATAKLGTYTTSVSPVQLQHWGD